MAPTMLDGVCVLDLTTFLAGPFATQLLSDLGADVIKVESQQGDSSRNIPPHFVGGDSVYFHAVNRTKRSIQLDLKHDAGREAFLRLVRGADVVFENFRPGVMERLGLSQDVLSEANAQLITCSLSGFGADSPHADRPAYDAMIQAMAGPMSLTGHPGQPPARMGLPMGDLAAGMYGAMATVAALRSRDHGGGGEHLDVAMFDCQIALLGYQAAYYLASSEVPGPQGAGHVSIPTYRTFLCADDRYVMVTANTEKMWTKMCEALELSHLVTDERFTTNAQRLRHREELWPILEERFCQIPSTTAVETLSGVGVPIAPVNTVADALADQQVAHRELIWRLAAGGEHTVEVPGNPIRTARGSVRQPDAATVGSPLGADTSEVLKSLAGLSDDQIADLQGQGVAGPF